MVLQTGSTINYLRNNNRTSYANLNWKQYPTYQQLKYSCELIWEYLVDSNRMGNVSSGSQLAYRINLIRTLKNVKALIAREIKTNYGPEQINNTIEDVLDFVRFWGQYNFPKYIMALDRIQKEIFQEYNLEPGEFSFFATQIECLFTDPLFVALDEYGIPIQTSDKLKYQLDTSGNLDSLLSQIKHLQVDSLKLTPFEKELIEEVKQQL